MLCPDDCVSRVAEYCGLSDNELKAKRSTKITRDAMAHGDCFPVLVLVVESLMP